MLRSPHDTRNNKHGSMIRGLYSKTISAAWADEVRRQQQPGPSRLRKSRKFIEIEIMYKQTENASQPGRGGLRREGVIN